MLLLAAIAHLSPRRAQQSEQGAVALNPAVGHIGLTIIALVYVLIMHVAGLRRSSAMSDPASRRRPGAFRLSLYRAEYLTLQHHPLRFAR